MTSSTKPSGLVDRHIAFLHALRAAGVPVSLAEGVDAVAALSALPWDDRASVRTAYAATVVKREAHRPTFETLFELYFPRAGRRRSHRAGRAGARRPRRRRQPGGPAR